MYNNSLITTDYSKVIEMFVRASPCKGRVVDSRTTAITRLSPGIEPGCGPQVPSDGTQRSQPVRARGKGAKVGDLLTKVVILGFIKCRRARFDLQNILFGLEGNLVTRLGVG